ncbi:nicotinamide mononucleotide transporter family protein [Streptomyces acidiscabies]|uniref:Nicotinamide mononucleotide transporter family protein n=1 Tax=Streptomyces acidiscabies TaxID=42234 RepID=A0AAP6B862_9ACTN|nr:nicotinamide mononucleotide transporter family protein [Streptomyces acidiscabies]MBP5940842.1 nicotinamide mononucleotide transporter [Streptomyces sp. LBUM 1476]MBZ3912129.1 nicotinamide mononucleotide transporter [Streptomyces acidiscabies]MDX2959938.1 nicotinamide mononucleotide transporter family protein [Streptomyces acidiscabies]MDX3024145.1 nicotinamide mononucleotide transporter family protein [Streptomyces acidiscabies]MDX3794568.1 nicotinamide mononucleotide transporter family pr
MNGLNSEAFVLFDQHIIWSDMIGNILGLVALALGWRRHLLTWPVQFASGLILFSAFYGHLAGSAGKQVVVMAVAAYGWWQWSRNRAQGRIVPRFASWNERGAMIVAGAAGTVAVALIFKANPSLSWDPWPDAYIFVGTLVAMYAQAKGMVEFWFAWLLVDAVGVPLNFANGYAFSGFVYVIYGALVLWGMRDWWLRSRRTALEGVPA